MNAELDLTAIKDLLTELTMGTVGLRLYGPDHPRAQEAVERGCRTIAGLVAVAPAGSLSLLELDGQLVVEGQPVNHLGPQAPALIRSMRRAGIERITLARGIDRKELQALLTFLADPAGAAPTLPHVAVGGVRLAGGEAGGGDEALSEAPASRLRDRVALTGEALEALFKGHEEGLALAEDVVQDLDRFAERTEHPSTVMAPLEEPDTWPAVHSHNVATVVIFLASFLGVPRARCLDLGLAGLLHDLGRMGAQAEREWRKDLERTGDDLEGDPQHPLLGFKRALSITGLPRLVPVAALEHHLDVTGAGWPNLTTQQPPHPVAQLVAAAESFDLLHTVRGPRDGAGREGVAAACLELGGVRFDPFIARLLAVFEETTPED